MDKNNTSEKKIQPCAPMEIPPHAQVLFTRQGERYGELVYMAKGIPRQTIQKLDKERYVVLKSGEIKEFESHENKQKVNLRRTFDELKGIIRANFDADGHNQLFITLTYKENMTDVKRLYADFDDFWKRVRRRLKEHRLEYVAVAEPQGRGAWHMHLMVKSDKPVLYIDKKELSSIWGHGYTTTERLKGDDVGAYYVSYFTNLELDEKTVVQAKNGSKKYRKGARLPLYPKYFKLYRCSRGIIRPKSENSVYKQIVDEYDNPVHSSAFEILNNENPVNVIQKESFKKS